MYACTNVYTYVYGCIYTCVYVYILLHIYTCMCVHVCVCVCIYIFFFIFSPPMMVYHRHCIEFPVLSGSTFFIHSVSSHLYLLVPNSQSIPPCPTLATTSLFFVFVSLYNMVSKLKFMALSGASSRREGCCAALSFGGDFRRPSRVVLAVCVLHVTCTL